MHTQYLNDIYAIAPSFKRRLSGVTSTVINLIPRINALGFSIAAMGPALPQHVKTIRYRDLIYLWIPPKQAPYRVWHARRNTEMLLGIILKHIFRMPLKLVFTSASQKKLDLYKCWLLRRMDSVVATSHKTASFLPVPGTVILHGVDTKRFVPAQSKSALKEKLGFPKTCHLIGFIGRIRYLKGTDLFVQSCIPVLKANPDWHAVIIGRITKAHQDFAFELNQHIQAAGLSQQFHFLEEAKDIEHYYAALDIYVAPQRYEGFGLTPLEALSCGVPVVATDVGAYRECIPPSCGIINDMTTEALTATISHYIDNPDIRNDHSKNARLHATEHLDITHEAQSLINVYYSLCGIK